jgi:hypothetical protein
MEVLMDSFTTYFISDPPILRPFKEMTRTEAKIYFKWFIEQIPTRISMLQQAVNSSSRLEFREWVANKMPDSLILLAEWFAHEITTRPLSNEDQELIAQNLEQIPTKYRIIYSQPEQVLTDKTYSLITDIGMYLGEVFRKQFPQLEWQLFVQGKKYADYQKPVLSGFGDTECNPIDLVQVVALGLIKKTVEPARLYEIYSYWTHQVFSKANNT